MRLIFIISVLLVGYTVRAQEERDTILKRCPIYITDTVSSNNFFIESLPATLKVERIKGDLAVTVQQRDQFFTIFFEERKLSTGKYTIRPNPKKKSEVIAKYSFRSADQVSYINVSNGTIESTYDKDKKFWHLKVNGMIANLVERSVTWYRVRADLYLKD